MTTYSQHTVDTAPEGSKPILSAIKGKMGFVPNLMATMAESPVLAESYMTMMGIFEKTDLTPTEREIILMTNNRLHGCTYCMAAHTAVSKMAGVDDSVIDALRAGTPISDPKLEALRNFAEIINETRGWLAFVAITLLLFVIVAFIRRVWSLDRPAALAFLPYLVWVSFASVLNLSVALLN